MVEQDNVLDLTLSLETIQLVKQKIAIIRQQEEKGRMVELLKKKLKQFGEELNPAEVDWETETDNAIILLKACLLSVQTF